MTTVEATGPISFDAETHTYWHGMTQVPAVSEIMRPLTEQYLRSVPEDILNWKRDLGIAVHKACELLDLGTLDEDALDEQILPYLEAYKRFLVDHRPEWEAIESIVFSEAEWYAGTLDRRGTIRQLPTIIDIKTSKEVASYAGIQLFAYAAAEGVSREASLQVLQLRKDGDYRLVPFTNLARYRETWRGLQAIYRWTKENRK